MEIGSKVKILTGDWKGELGVVIGIDKKDSYPIAVRFSNGEINYYYEEQLEIVESFNTKCTVKEREKMNTKICNVKCIKSTGRLFTFPLTQGKIYKNAKVIWTKDIKEDGGVTLINDLGKKDFYSMQYFEIVE